MTSLRTVILSYALGTGHKQVAEILSAELAVLGHGCEHRPLETWVPLEYDLLFRHGYLFLALKHPKVWDAMYTSPRFTRREALALPLMRPRAVKAFARTGFGGADLVVATQYNAMEVAADWKKTTGSALKLAAVITDYDIYPLWARPEVDLFLLPHADLVPLLESRGIPRDRIQVTGLPISPRFETATVREDTLAALGLDSHARTAMVFGGGGGMGPLRASAEACLGTPGWQVIMVCGLNERLRRSMRAAAQAEPERLRVLGYRRDIPSLMQASDAVITKGGGLSLTEALYSRSRVIVIPGLPGQEQVNVRFMEKLGWVEACGRPEALPSLLPARPAVREAAPGLPRAPARAAALALDALARGQTSHPRVP